MYVQPADYDALADRVEALEEVVRKLMQHLVKDHVMTSALRTEVVDSLIDMATGNPRQEAQAERWRGLLEGG